MRVDGDFESYAAARWHLVVRTLVLLGVPPGHAATLTRQALVRRKSEWSHQDGFDDLDAELYREVLDLKRHDDAAWWGEPGFDEDLWVEIEPELDRLEPAQREWLVLRHVAELPESYIAAVVGEPDPGVRSGAPSGERLREVARLVPVQAPDLEQVVAMASESVRRHRRRGFAVTAAVIGVAGLVSLVVALSAGDGETGSPGRELALAPVERASSDATVGWYADGRLHLSDVILDLPDLQSVAVINDGAVYLDDGGDLVQVNDQGERTLLDTIGDDGTFAASDSEGLVAWLPEVLDGDLVVRNLAARKEVARVPVSGTAEVIAIDAGSVYFRDDAGDHELKLPGGEVEALGSANLIDVALRVRLFQHLSGVVRMEQPLFDIAYTWPGEDAQISEEGTVVLTWVGDRLAMHDTRSGEWIATDIGPNEGVLDAEFGPDNTIVYLVMNELESGGIVDVRTCSLGRTFLDSGAPAAKCIDEYAGQFSGLDTDLQLAR